jgi:hypothetical protein
MMQVQHRRTTSEKLMQKLSTSFQNTFVIFKIKIVAKVIQFMIIQIIFAIKIISSFHYQCFFRVFCSCCYVLLIFIKRVIKYIVLSMSANNESYILFLQRKLLIHLQNLKFADVFCANFLGNKNTVNIYSFHTFYIPTQLYNFF